MKLPDTTDNSEIVYLYVKSFKWFDPIDNENNVGEPKESIVYRAVVNRQTGTYRLVYMNESKQMTAVYLPCLVTGEESQYNYQSDISEINKKTILDLGLAERDLDLMLVWIKENNSSLKQALGLETQQAPPQQMNLTSEQVINVIQRDKEDKFLNKVGASLINIRNFDPALFEAICDLIFFEEDMASPANDTESLGYSAVLGAGVNISKATEALKRYGSDDRRSNLDHNDLLEAHHNLLVESGRRLIHNIQ